MSEENKAIARRGVEVFNDGNVDVLDEIVAEDAQSHDPQNPFFTDERGPEPVKKTISLYRRAFPDLHFEIEDQIAEGDRVVTRWTAIGTNDGEIMGMPATGKSSTVVGISIDRIEDGKIQEAWVCWDTMGMMQQLGLVPEQAAAAS